jgi:hypothetical protein
MIVEIDGHSQAAKSQDRWHNSSYHNPKRLGYETIAARPFPAVASQSPVSVTLWQFFSLHPAATQFKVEIPPIPA